jgi:hypothetical protein
MKVNARTRLETLEDQEQSIHEEARMVLPGVQALFGFQLVAVFNQRFTALDATDRAVYFLSLLLVTGAVGLLMAPAALHRLAQRKCVSDYFVDVSSKLVASSMPPLALAIALDVYLVARLAFGDADRTASEVIAGIVLGVLMILWFIFPLHRRSSTAGREEEPHRTTR